MNIVLYVKILVQNINIVKLVKMDIILEITLIV